MNETNAKPSESKPWAIRKGGVGVVRFSDGDAEPVRFHDHPHMILTASEASHAEAHELPDDAVIIPAGATSVALETRDGGFQLFRLDAPPLPFVRCDLLRKREDEPGARDDFLTTMIQAPPKALLPSSDQSVTPESGAPQS